ncbi:MAG: dienelactone hydrolase family protein [Thermoplasmata archaeon]
MRDDDRMMDLPSEFGSGVIGVCDICGARQAVIVLSKERFKLCVIDFLNKSWVKSEKKPGAPAPLYRSERTWFETEATSSGRAPAIVLSPTKVVKHPVVLVTPDVYGITTTLLDGAIRFAREGYEVMIPDIGKTDAIGAGHHMALRTGARLRGGVSLRSKKVIGLLHLYTDALAFLRQRDMVDPAKTAVFGVSYGASLALVLGSQDTKLTAVVLAYPYPVSPPDLGKLVTAPILFVGGSGDRFAQKAKAQLLALRASASVPVEVMDIPGARHGFLARDLSAYDLPHAEEAWTRILSFLKLRLLPPPPKPPMPAGIKPAAPPARAPGTPAPPTPPPAASPSPAAPAPRPAAPPTGASLGPSI